MIGRTNYERLVLSVKKLEWACRLTRKTLKKSPNKSFFQKELNQRKKEARHHLLALCFFRGTLYCRVEQYCRVPPNIPYLRQIIYEYLSNSKKDWRYITNGELPVEKDLQFWLKGDYNGKVVLPTKNRG